MGATAIGRDLWLIEARPEEAGAGLRAVLAGVLHAGPDAIEIGHRPDGRPFLAMPGPVPDLSLARRGPLLLVALGRRVGCDVEIVPAGEDGAEADRRLAGTFFSGTECRWLDGLAPSERRLGFFHLWTAKEAVLKALGTGIAGGLAEPDLGPMLRPGRLPPGRLAGLVAKGETHTLHWYRHAGQDGLAILARADTETWEPCQNSISVTQP